MELNAKGFVSLTAAIKKSSALRSRQINGGALRYH